MADNGPVRKAELREAPISPKSRNTAYLIPITFYVSRSTLPTLQRPPPLHPVGRLINKASAKIFCRAQSSGTPAAARRQEQIPLQMFGECAQHPVWSSLLIDLTVEVMVKAFNRLPDGICCFLSAGPDPGRVLLLKRIDRLQFALSLGFDRLDLVFVFE